MGIAKQYECPKCGYKPPILHFGCGFYLSYEVYVCRVCKTLQSSLCHIHSSYRKDEEKEYLEETVLLPNITNNIEIEEKFCNHHSCQELSSIHYNIKSTFSSLDNSIPHFRFYHTAKDVEQVNSRGCRYFVRCNDCNKEIEFDVFEDRLTNKCALCGNINLEKWDEPYCPKCGEKMIFGIGDEGFCFGEWD